MKIIRIIVYFILIQFIAVTNTFSFEKVGTTSFQFLKVLTTARANALAGAYSSLANTADAVFWNPAGLSLIKSFDATIGYTDWFMDVGHFSFSGAYTIDNIGTFAVFGMVADVGEIKETKVSALGFINGVYNPGLTGNTFSPKSMLFGISYGKAINNRFSFGLTMKYGYEDLVYESVSGLIFDGGIRFDTNFRSVILAASIRNFGTEITFIDKSYPLPQTLNIGISAYLFSNNDPLFSSAGDHSLLLSVDLIQPRDFDQQYAVGMEYAFNDLLYLRGGYLFNNDQEGMSLGAGVNYKGYKFDYALNDYGEYLDSVHRFTIGVSIN